MIHEPECALAGKQYTVPCGICATIQKAYQRGREDAATIIAKDIRLKLHHLVEGPHFGDSYAMLDSYVTGMAHAHRIINEGSDND